jgi:hypothetical protein
VPQTHAPQSARGKITALATLELDWSLAMRRQPTRLACEYWQRCRAVDWAPRRADLHPGAMRKFLPHIGLVTVQREHERAVYTIRQAGTAWEDIFGPMTGKRLGEFLPVAIQERWREVFDAVCDAVAPLRVTTRIEFQRKSWLKTELFVAPVRDGADAISMLFVCFDSWSEV